MEIHSYSYRTKNSPTYFKRSSRWAPSQPIYPFFLLHICISNVSLHLVKILGLGQTLFLIIKHFDQKQMNAQTFFCTKTYTKINKDGVHYNIQSSHFYYKSHSYLLGRIWRTNKITIHQSL